MASAGPMLTTQLTDEQKQNKNWTERGEQLFRDLAPEKAVNIRRTLSKIKQDKNAERIVGCIMDKVATCPRADAGLEAGVTEKDLVFTNLPATTSSALFNEILRTIDPLLDGEAIANGTKITTALAQPDGHMSTTVRGLISLVTPTAKFVAWAKGTFDTHNAIVDNLLIHRNFEDPSDTPAKYGKMLGDTRDAGAQALLDICFEIGLSAAQVEYVITTESQRSLVAMQYGGSIIATHFDTVTAEDNSHRI